MQDTSLYHWRNCQWEWNGRSTALQDVCARLRVHRWMYIDVSFFVSETCTELRLSAVHKPSKIGHPCKEIKANTYSQTFSCFIPVTRTGSLNSRVEDAKPRPFYRSVLRDDLTPMNMILAFWRKLVNIISEWLQPRDSFMLCDSRTRLRQISLMIVCYINSRE